jgi:anti-anti-sigma factor
MENNVFDDNIIIKIVQANDVMAIIDIRGNINIDTVEILNNNIDKVIQEHNPKNFIFQCKGIKFVSSIGIGCFMNLYKRVIMKNGGKLLFVGMRGNMKESFRLLHLERFFIIKENLRDALIEINKIE